MSLKCGLLTGLSGRLRAPVFFNKSFEKIDEAQDIMTRGLLYVESIELYEFHLENIFPGISRVTLTKYLSAVS